MFIFLLSAKGTNALCFGIFYHHSTPPHKILSILYSLDRKFNLYSDEDGVKHIRIKARHNKWHENDYPFCHKSCPAYDKHSSRPTTWRGLDWGGILVEVEYQTHRIICLEHGVYVAEVPWAYPGNRFTKDFDLTVAWFAYPICCARFTLNIVKGQP